MKKEMIPCPLCNQKENQTVHHIDQFELKKCSNCHLVYVANPLDETELLELYKDDNYFSGGDQGYKDCTYSNQKKAFDKTFERFVKSLGEKHYTGGSLLEVGCGEGYLLEASQGYFSQVCGVELSKGAADIARKVVDTVWGSLEEIPEGKTFDCIIATHVIEHVPNPVEFVNQLKGYLKVGGSLILAAPDYSSPIRSVMGNKWPSFKLPEHVTYYTYETLETLMKKTNLSKCQSIPYLHAFPASLIASKFGVRLPESLGNLNLWVPWTTTCCAATMEKTQ